ncbi:MAG: TlpA family protein disulfide reductase [Armatimonadota bacterium]
MDIAKRLLGICAAGVVILIVILSFGRKPPRSALVGGRAPAFVVINTNGVAIHLRDMTASPVLLCFWLLHDGAEGTEVVSTLDTLARDVEGLPGLLVAAVNCDASPEEIAEFAKDKDLKCRILHMGDDPEKLRTITKLYHLDDHELPRFFLLDSQKDRIAADLEGRHTAEELKQAILDANLLPWLTERKEDGS